MVCCVTCMQCMQWCIWGMLCLASHQRGCDRGSTHIRSSRRKRGTQLCSKRFFWTRSLGYRTTKMRKTPHMWIFLHPLLRVRLFDIKLIRFFFMSASPTSQARVVVAWLAALLTDLSLRFPDDRSLHLMALCVCHGIPMVTVFLCIYIYR